MMLLPLEPVNKIEHFIAHRVLRLREREINIYFLCLQLCNFRMQILCCFALQKRQTVEKW